MANEPMEEVDAVFPVSKEIVETVPPAPKWQKLLRQNSEKIANLAEEVVLPKNQRTLKRNQHIAANISLQDVDGRGAYMPTTVPIRNPVQMQPKYIPVFMIGISVVQIALMYLMNNDVLILRLGYDPHRRYEVWRFITLMLTHTGRSHLWPNVLLQMILGVLLEIIHNSKRIGIIYISSILGGSLFITLLDPRQYAVGASAGVYGLLFSHLSTIILNWYEMDRKCCRLVALLLYIIIDLAISLSLAFTGEASTNFAGHLGGAITGFLVSILVLKSFERRNWERIMQKICIGILVLLCIIIVLVNVFARNHYLPTECDFNYESTYEDYVFNLAIGSPQESPTYKYCWEHLRCRLRLNQYNLNGTIRT